MSKTFKSAFEDSSYRLEVCKNAGAEHVSLWILGCGLASTSIAIADKDSPALALAILEAAGFKAEFHAAGTFQDGDCWQLENVAQVIKDYLSIKDAEAAEEEAQAELEAEALKLLNASLASCDLGQVELFDALNPLEQQRWLAVARKAREIGAEK